MYCLLEEDGFSVLFFKFYLGCPPKKLHSKWLSNWFISPIYEWGIPWGYNPLILTIWSIHFLGHPPAGSEAWERALLVDDDISVPGGGERSRKTALFGAILTKEQKRYENVDSLQYLYGKISALRLFSIIIIHYLKMRCENWWDDDIRSSR